MSIRNLLPISVLAMAMLALPVAPASAGETITLDLAYAPSTIGPGSATRATFTLTNNDNVPQADVKFDQALNTAIRVADPGSATTTCTGGIVTADIGSSVISLADATLGANGSCSVAVDVTSSTPGTHTSFVSYSGAIDFAQSGRPVDVVVDPGRPGVTKSFGEDEEAPTCESEEGPPDECPKYLQGDDIRLTILFDNARNSDAASLLDVVDNLPLGLVVADQPDPSNSCTAFGGQLTANPGGNTVSLSGGFVDAESTCSIAVTLTAEGPVQGPNRSEPATASGVDLGFAVAPIAVAARPFRKTVLNNPVAPGGVVAVEFTVYNTGGSFADGGFTDDVGAMLPGTTVKAPLPTDPCGQGSKATGQGAGVLVVEDASLLSGATCSFTVLLQLPGSGEAVGDVFVNETSEFTATGTGEDGAGGRGEQAGPIVLPAASDTVEIGYVSLLTKDFTVDPVAAGGTTELRFTIQNPDPDAAMTDISFEDDLDAFLSGLHVETTPRTIGTVTFPGPFTEDDVCGAGSNLSASSTEGGVLSLTGGQIAAGGSCEFGIELTPDRGTSGGVYTNRVTDFTMGTTYGQALPADMEVLQAAVVVLDVTDDPVLAGGTANLQIEIGYETDQGVTHEATGISFDVTTDLSGLGSSDLPLADLCGPGNGIAAVGGTGFLQVSHVTLAPGDICVIYVPVDVPGTTRPSAYDVQATAPTSTVAGTPVIGYPAVTTLSVPGVVATKEFLDESAIPGSSTTLEFTLSNVTPGTTYDSIAFTDDLADMLAGTTASDGPQADVCGTGSQLTSSRGGVLSFTGGILTPGSDCTFAATVVVPAAAVNGDYRNTTSQITYQDTEGALTGLPATDLLTVDDALIAASKTFNGYPVRAGGMIELEFSLTNLSPSEALSDIEFDDDLEAVLPGLTASGLPLTDVCGTGSTVDGTSTIAFSGGSLPAGATCEFSVTLLVPGHVTTGGTFVNTTTPISGVAASQAVAGAPATDDLVVSGAVGFVKTFDGPTAAGGTVQLGFEISNGDSALTDIEFTDDLDGVLAGLSVAGSVPAAPCGPGSSLELTPILTLRDGSLDADEVCAFEVNLSVPGDAAPGTYANLTSELRAGGVSIAIAAGDDLQVEPAPVFSKTFAPDDIDQGASTTATYDIDNSGSVLDASGLDFADALLPGLSVASPANASTTCTGGTLTVPSGGSSIAYTGGTVPAGSACAVQVDVRADEGGVYVDETGELTSSSGSSGTAVDTLVVAIAPALDKDFLADTVAVGASTTLILTLDNSANGVDVDIVDLSDDLPDGMQIADPSNAVTTCIGGTLTAPAGGTSISYAGGQAPAGTSCRVDVDVTTTSPGVRTNTTDPLVTGNGTSPAASADLRTQSDAVGQVDPVGDLQVLGSALPAVVQPDGSSEVTFAVTNLGPQARAGTLTFTVPEGVVLDGVIGCTQLIDANTCTLPPIRVDETVEVTLLTTHPAEGTDTFAATVGGTFDPDMDNNSTTVDVFVRPLGGTASESLIEAAIQASRERFPSGGFSGDSDTDEGAVAAVLARVDVFADSLAGSVLTGQAPLLFTAGTELDPAVADEIRRVLPLGGTVYLLGGTAALSTTVEDAVTALGMSPIRLEGPSRIETALAVADQARATLGGDDVGVARAYGTEDNPTAAWADSVTGGGWAAATGTPIVLTPSDDLHPAVAAWIQANVPGDRTILGGTGAVSDGVASALAPAARVSGPERAATAVAVARELRGVEPEGPRAYLLINGYHEDGWGYGLIAAGLSADTGAPVLITDTDTAPPATRAEVTSCAQQPISLRSLAPTVQLTDALLAQLDALDSEPCDGAEGEAPMGGSAAPGDRDAP